FVFALWLGPLPRAMMPGSAPCLQAIAHSFSFEMSRSRDQVPLFLLFRLGLQRRPIRDSWIARFCRIGLRWLLWFFWGMVLRAPSVQDLHLHGHFPLPINFPKFSSFLARVLANAFKKYSYASLPKIQKQNAMTSNAAPTVIVSTQFVRIWKRLRYMNATIEVG